MSRAHTHPRGFSARVRGANQQSKLPGNRLYMLLKVSAVREPMSRFGRYLLIMSADGLEVRQKEIMSGRTKVLNRAIVLNRLGGKKQMKE
jgi:hypothetical protein